MNGGFRWGVLFLRVPQNFILTFHIGDVIFTA